MSGESARRFLEIRRSERPGDEHTATAKQIACSQVLSVMDRWETLDVSKSEH